MNSKTYNLSLTAETLTLIERGLMKLPGEVCFPIINDINRQLAPQLPKPSAVPDAIDTSGSSSANSTNAAAAA